MACDCCQSRLITIRYPRENASDKELQPKSPHYHESSQSAHHVHVHSSWASWPGCLTSCSFLAFAMQDSCGPSTRRSHCQSWSSLWPCTYYHGWKWFRFYNGLCCDSNFDLFLLYRQEGQLQLLGAGFILQSRERKLHRSRPNWRSHSVLSVSILWVLS